MSVADFGCGPGTMTRMLAALVGSSGSVTGIDLQAMIEASRTAQQVLGRPLGSHVLSAGPVEWVE